MMFLLAGYLAVLATTFFCWRGERIVTTGSVILGSGDDVVEMSGLSVTIGTGDGGGSVDLGVGDDTFTAGLPIYVLDDSGDLVRDALGGYVPYNSLAHGGRQRFRLEARGESLVLNGLLSAGAGDDVITLSGSSSTSGGIGFESRGDVRLGSGDDSLILAGSQFGGVRLKGGAFGGEGSDAILVRGAADVFGDLDGGTGNDFLSILGDARIRGDVRGGSGDDVMWLLAGTIEGDVLGERGNDSILIDGATVRGDVDGGAGDDRILMLSGRVGGSLLGGLGSDTITFAGGVLGDLVSPWTDSSGNIEGGIGNDVIRVEGGIVLGRVLGGEGEDAILTTFRREYNRQGVKDDDRSGADRFGVVSGSYGGLYRAANDATTDVAALARYDDDGFALLSAAPGGSETRPAGADDVFEGAYLRFDAPVDLSGGASLSRFLTRDSSLAKIQGGDAVYVAASGTYLSSESAPLSPIFKRATTTNIEWALRDDDGRILHLARGNVDVSDDVKDGVFKSLTSFARTANPLWAKRDGEGRLIYHARTHTDSGTVRYTATTNEAYARYVEVTVGGVTERRPIFISDDTKDSEGDVVLTWQGADGEWTNGVPRREGDLNTGARLYHAAYTVDSSESVSGDAKYVALFTDDPDDAVRVNGGYVYASRYTTEADAALRRNGAVVYLAADGSETTDVNLARRVGGRPLYATKAQGYAGGVFAARYAVELSSAARGADGRAIVEPVTPTIFGKRLEDGSSVFAVDGGSDRDVVRVIHGTIYGVSGGGHESPRTLTKEERAKRDRLGEGTTDALLARFLNRATGDPVPLYLRRVTTSDADEARRDFGWCVALRGG